MGVQLAWDNESRDRLRLTFGRSFSLRDVERAWESVPAFLMQVTHTVDILCVFLDDDVPPGLWGLLHQLAAQTRANLGLIMCSTQA
jgi:hypothetical protein